LPPFPYKKNLFIVLGLISLALGIIGAILPIMPTVPFLILAAFFFSKGSEKLHRWLLSNQHFGHHIKNWEQNGSISKCTKIYSVAMIILLSTNTMIFVNVNLWIKVSVLIICLGAIIFIISRPTSC